MKKALMLMGVVGMICVSCGRDSGTLVVTNHGGDTADQIVVSAGGKDHVFSKLRNGESESQDFRVGADGSVAVSVLMMDGMGTTNGFTYVTGAGAGPEKRMEIEINEDREIVGVQK